MPKPFDATLKDLGAEYPVDFLKEKRKNRDRLNDY